METISWCREMLDALASQSGLSHVWAEDLPPIGLIQQTPVV